MKVRILLLLVLIPVFTQATTFSYLYSDITPISINQKGEILCKTRFAANMTGGSYAYDFVKYGFCVISKDSMHYFKGITLVDVTDYSNEKFTFWDAIYNKTPSENCLKKIVSDVLKNSFTFSQLNTDKFKVDSSLSKKAFQKKYGCDVNKTRQKALFEALSNKNSCHNEIHIAYDFGETILLNNYSYWEEDELVESGCFFRYYFKNYYEGGGFDVYRVIGVLFKDA